MSITTKKISLDFYNNNIVIINAKQGDVESRAINVTCTDYGRKVMIDPTTMSAFVRYKKSDGNAVFNDVLILEDGTLYFTLSPQMLASAGKQVVDIMIFSSTDITVDNLSEATSFEDLGTAVISTMTFYVNVSPHPDDSQIISSNEFNALVSAMARLNATETHFNELDSTLNENEEIRKANEEGRINAENARNTSESNRSSSEQTRIDNETKRQQNESKRQNDTATAISNCNTAANNTIDAINSCVIATDNCNDATERALAVINTDIAQSTVTFTENPTRENIQSGEYLTVMLGKIQKWFSDMELKGVAFQNVANNLDTVDSGYLLDARQGKVLNDFINDCFKDPVTESDLDNIIY